MTTELPPAPRDEWGRSYSAYDRFGELVWIRPGSAREIRELVVTLEPSEAMWILEDWMRDPSTAEMLTKLDRELHGTSSRDGLRHAERLREVARRLADDLRFESIVLQRVRQVGFSGTDGRPEAPSAPQPAPSVAKTWIEVVLLDEDTRAPLSDELVRLVAPSGEVHERRTNAQGSLRLERLDPGSCDVCFPQFDGGEWRREGAPAQKGAASSPSGQRVLVQPGDTALRIAARHGFRRLASVWLRAENDAIRALRRSPDVLAPGDELFVPGLEPRLEGADTTKRHVYLAPRPRERLRARFEWSDRTPMASRAFTLELEGAPITGSTDAAGFVDVAIPLGLREASLHFDDDPELVWSLAIGELDPVDEPTLDAGLSGAIARLRNLAHYQCEASDPLHLGVAACNFSVELSEAARALLDPERSRLRSDHGC
jgi:hypothetical protein